MHSGKHDARLWWGQKQGKNNIWGFSTQKNKKKNKKIKRKRKKKEKQKSLASTQDRSLRTKSLHFKP
jgi:lauroyl/myristoyl acyltransferase